MPKKIAILLVVLLLFGCNKPPTNKSSQEFADLEGYEFFSGEITNFKISHTTNDWDYGDKLVPMSSTGNKGIFKFGYMYERWYVAYWVKYNDKE